MRLTAQYLRSDHMKKTLYFLLALAAAGNTAAAQSPIPTFDKDAVTVYPYNRTGEETAVEDRIPEFQAGNTGTEEAPAFYVRRIELTGFSLPDERGELAALLEEYTHRSVKTEELSALTARLTAYAKSCGYPVAQAVIPPQEVKAGVLEVRVYVASYDEVKLASNTTDVADSVLEGYLHKMKTGETMTDRTLEAAVNNLNDLPGVTARAVLRPGSAPGTTAVDIEAARRPVWNNYVFVDNGGGYYSGRYRYGFNTEINNPGHQGDKIVLSGTWSSHDVENYAARYELPVGRDGTRLGVAYSRSEYELHTNGFYDSLGKSEGLSLYGLTPLYRTRSDRLTLIYGYDHRKITNRYRFRLGDIPTQRMEKDADVWHVGISGSQYLPNEFLQYDLIYWYGNMDAEDGAFIDGAYHKLTGDLLKVWYDGPWNYRIRTSWQLGSRALDGSEQFYLGGMNGVRGYGNGDGYGDSGWLGTAEVRRATGIEGLEAALFVDAGYAKDRVWDRSERLYSWGVGLRYAMPNDWYAQLDYARKFNARPDLTEPTDHDGRVWFQVYKMF